jgi:GNAT superfamily N-acetyltransferase
MPLVLDSDWVGRRVVIRYAAGGAAGRGVAHDVVGDVVGDLVGLDAGQARVLTRAGPVLVERTTIVAARPVEAAPRDVLALERVAAQGWQPAERQEVDGWMLRADHGFSHRANSVLALSAPRPDLETALARAGDWYGARGLPLILAVPLVARDDLARDLERRGWSLAMAVEVMTAHLEVVGARLATRARPGPSGLRVQLAATPDDAWLSRYGHPMASDLEIVRTTLARHERVSFATIRDGGATIGVARGVVDDGWLGVSAVAVDPRHRRQGLAGVLLAALCAWARSDHGAQRSYLQVEATNATAITLYEHLGYWHHHTYHYCYQP